jgi:type IV pilus assembly protein PilC
MADFVWEARSRTGELRKGVMEADNQAAVETRLRQQQLNPVKVRRRGAFANISFGSGVGPKELVVFTRQFATMIDAGLPLVQCLDILANQQDNKIFQAALRDIKAHVEEGATFSDALRRHPRIFDDLY